MGTIKHRGEYQFQAIIRKKGSPNKSKTFESRREAESWIRTTEIQMAAGIFVDTSDAPQETLRDLLKRYLEEVTPKHKGSESETYRINAFMRDEIASYKITNLNPAVLRHYRDRRLKKVQSGTVRRELELLRTLFTVAFKEWGIEIANPVSLITLPEKSAPRDRRLLRDEELWLLKGLEETGRCENGTFAKGARNPLLKPAMQLAIATAMRQSEILNLDWQHIHLEDKIAFLPETKNGNSREVALSLGAIAVFKSLGVKTSGSIFPITAAALKKGFSRSRERAIAIYLADCSAKGIVPKDGFLKGFRWHDARHEAISRMVPRMANELEASAMSGHKDMQMLKRYYHPDMTAIANKLDD